MKSGAGKRKGNAFERLICKLLSLWWTESKDDSCFWRTSNSGGRATVRSKQSKTTPSHYGDMGAVDERGKPFTDLMTVELKSGYSNDTIHDLFDSPGRSAVQQYQEWIAKAEEDHLAARSFSWMLIHRRDRREPMVLTPPKLLNALDQLTGINVIEFPLKDRSERLAFLPLWEWMESVEPKEVVEYHALWKGIQ